MARYKDYDYTQMKMIPVSFERQILPGSFEYSLSYLIDNELVDSKHQVVVHAEAQNKENHINDGKY